MLVLASCQKESTAPVTNNAHLSDDLELAANPRDGFDYSKCDSLKNAVTISEGYLVFSDEQHFWDCVTCLEYDYDLYNDNYEAQYPEATPEELDSVDIVNNFDQWQPYIDFEQSLNFSSLRAKIESEILAFEQIPDSLSDPSEDPDLSIPVLRESVRTLFNENGMAKIEADILSMSDWEEDPALVWDDCAFYRKREFEFNQTHDPTLVNRKMTISIAVRSGLITSNLKGKYIFRKRINGKWKRKRANTKLLIWGRPYRDVSIPNEGSTCTPDFDRVWSKSKDWKKRKSRTATSSIWGYWREALVEPTAQNFMGNRSRIQLLWKAPNGVEKSFLLDLRR